MKILCLHFYLGYENVANVAEIRVGLTTKSAHYFVFTIS